MRQTMREQNELKKARLSLQQERLHNKQIVDAEFERRVMQGEAASIAI